jgi:lysine 2,3-aminomutase
VTLQPDYVVERRANETVLRSYRGEHIVYPEPEDTDCRCPYDEVWQARSR